MHLARKIRCSSFLLDSHTPCLVMVAQPQHRLRPASIEHEVGLLEQMTDIRTRVMAGHRMIGVAEKRFAIFGGYAGGA
jgi:hypothetical protein